MSYKSSDPLTERTLLREHLRAQFAAQLNDCVRRNVKAPRGLANRFGVGRLQAIAFLLVGTQKGKHPSQAQFVVHLLDGRGDLFVDFKLFGEVPLDKETRHG
jgi:hypothetical protein